MRSSLGLACLVAGIVCLFAVIAAGDPASAQTPFDGPLAAPDAPAAKPAVPKAQAKSKPKKTRHAAARSTGTAANPYAAPGEMPGQQPYRTPTATMSTGAASPSGPLSLGMKWQGNNDTPAQTRSQNLDGSAFGSGAEVGMKLHF